MSESTSSLVTSGVKQSDDVCERNTISINATISLIMNQSLQYLGEKRIDLNTHSGIHLEYIHMTKTHQSNNACATFG